MPVFYYHSIDFLSKKEYNYEYDGDTLVRATEYDIEFTEEVVTSKVLVNTVSITKSKTSKSKHRILNWDKDIEQPDDIEYFITNLEKYCD